MNVKAIDTKYDGYHFRSRLEARWAVFFNHAGIPYEYEPQGFHVANGKGYLPDFYLPECGTWVDVKGSPDKVSEEWIWEREPYLPKNKTPSEPVHGLMILGHIPKVEDDGLDPAWPVFSSGEGWQSGSCYGFGNYHKNNRPWWIDTSGYPNVEALTVPEYSADESETCRDIMCRAYRAARVARFEHGESPV